VNRVVVQTDPALLDPVDPMEFMAAADPAEAGDLLRA
jgi:hypothetical protein